MTNFPDTTNPPHDDRSYLLAATRCRAQRRHCYRAAGADSPHPLPVL
jgi:hypothetical protein